MVRVLTNAATTGKRVAKRPRSYERSYMKKRLALRVLISANTS
jgi:hypothetical protein